MLWQISEHVLFKKGLIYYENLVELSNLSKNKNQDICQGFSSILQEVYNVFLQADFNLLKPKKKQLFCLLVKEHRLKFKYEK